MAEPFDTPSVPECADPEPATDLPYSYTKEREWRFVLKLDIILISWAWCAYLFKLIDYSNYKTAYASGMKADLGFHGDQLNYLDTFYRIGYALFTIPSQLVLTRLRPNVWLPPLELAWGMMTGLVAATDSVRGLYALRFFIGVFEASSYPGILSVLCNWYTPAELATRIAIFGTSYPTSSMFVSVMQASLQSTLNGRYGIPGWKWLFIFNAIMTILVAFAGFLVVPNAPGDGRVFWMSKEDDAISRARMDRVRKKPATRMNLEVIRAIFSNWVIYVFSVAYALWSWSQNANTWIILFLKAVKNPNGSERFSIEEINAIPIGGYVLQLVAMLSFAWLSSRTGWRLTWIVVQQGTFMTGGIILSIWPPQFSVKMLGYFILWTSHGVGAILIAWMADCCPLPEERAIILGCGASLDFVVDAFANILIYPASQAPHYKIGYKAATAFAGASIVMAIVFKLFERRDQLRSIARRVVDVEKPGRGRMVVAVEDEDAEKHD